MLAVSSLPDIRHIEELAAAWAALPTDPADSPATTALSTPGGGLGLTVWQSLGQVTLRLSALPMGEDEAATVRAAE